MFKILVVCTANICRSPATSVFLSRKLNCPSVQVDTAGTRALDGNMADSVVRQLMDERGFHEIEKHRSRALMPHHVANCQLILVMERDHLEFVRKNYPIAVGKCMMLSHWSQGQDVDDPYGKSLSEYVTALEGMQAYSLQWAIKIRDMGLLE